MRVALLHGWRLSGSGSNEYTRYLARALVAAGHEVEILCREPEPNRFAFIDEACSWDAGGGHERMYRRKRPTRCRFHLLPHGPVRPVYVTDKQRTGVVKPYTRMTDAELDEHLGIYTAAVRAVLEAHPVDVLHANHLVLQPAVALRAGADLGVPVVVYPHGSAIEYTVRADPRFARHAREAIVSARGLVIGSREVRERLALMFPDLRARIEAASRIVGVGVDTTLFSPVARTGRERAIRRLIAREPGGGKPPGLTADLHARLARGEIEAVSAYGDAYPRALPDEDVAEHLARIPFEQGRILLFVGALTVGKGLQRVIAGLPRLLGRVPGAHLVIVGSGAYREVLEALVYALSTGDDQLLDQLTARGYDLVTSHLRGPWPAVSRYLADPDERRLALAAGPGFADRVHFLGRLPHDLLRHLFPCADVAVFPSVIPEAYPLVLMESLANGVLPAASYFSGFAEGIDALAPELGAGSVKRMRLPVAEGEAVAGTADRLAALLAEPASDELRDRLRQIAVREYDWSVRAAQMVRAYRELITEGEPA
jgi:glycosyltransferase involved in cell wall biosynthesis